MSLLLLLACTGPGKGTDSAGPCEVDSALPTACACADPVVEIGSGTISFEPVAEGSDATMVHGPQGGWHVLGSARFTNLNPIVTIDYDIVVVSSRAVVSNNTYRVQMVADGECGGYYPGMYGYLDVTELADGDLDTPPEILAGDSLRLEMVVTDTEGRTATDTLNVTAALDPIDQDTGTPEPDDSGTP